MGRNLLALVTLGYALWRSDLLHPNPFYALGLPIVGLAAFIYLMLRWLLRRRAGAGGDASGGEGGWSMCDGDDGGCGGDGGGD